MKAAPLALALSFLAVGARAGGAINDSDLSGGGSAQSASLLEAEGRAEGGALVFPAAASPRPSASASVTARSLRLARARLVGPGASESWTEADAQGRLALSAAGLSGNYRLRLSFDNRYWAFRSKGGESYEWETAPFSLSGAGADLGEIAPAAGSEHAKLAVLHQTYLDALGLLERDGDTDWWKKTLTVNWPGSADFFSPWAWSLDLTNALAWDVVLHELGHAVMHGAMRARAAGGQHKIDECYTEALAWSEGWATFFAASVRLKRGDPDAKFEYLVPRRAPIRLENVPGDVCPGSKNEWRVAAGLWDLHDLHEDGLDRWAAPFGPLWTALRGQTMGSMGDAWELIAKTLSPAERRAAHAALAQNTLLSPPSAPPAAVALSVPRFE